MMANSGWQKANGNGRLAKIGWQRAVACLAVLVLATGMTGCRKDQAAQTSPGAAPGENMGANTSANTPQQNYPTSQPSQQGQNTSDGMTPPTAAPGQTAPAPLPAGTRIHVRLGQTLDSRDTEEGQHFSGTLTAPVEAGGHVVYPAGAGVKGVVTEVKDPGKFKGEGVLSIKLTDIAGTPVRTEPFSQIVKGKGKRTAGFIGGGTGLGAVIGGIAGGGRGAAIGAVAGAGTGAVSGSMTDNKPVELPAESVVTFRTVR
jgi:hypothetical protein